MFADGASYAIDEDRRLLAQGFSPCAVRGQVIPPRLEPLMFSFQGDMFGLKHREFGGHC
jgi:hypothetical protein